MRFPLMLALPACVALAAQNPAPALVRGKVLDPKGEPLPAAEVLLLRAASEEAPLAQTRTDADGFFLLETRERGIFRLVVLGRAHKGVETLLLLNDTKPVDFTAHLAAFRLPPDAPCRVMGRIAGRPLPKDAVLAKQPDGTWAWETEAAAGEAWVGTLRGPEGALLPSRLDDVRVAGNGLLGVVKAEGGKIRIVADPKAYASEAAESTVSADTEGPEVRVLFRALEEAQRLTSPLLLAMRDAARKPGSLKPDAAPTLKALREASQKATPITRPIFMLNEASVSELGGQPMPRDLARDIVQAVGASSPIWSLFPSLPARIAKALEPEAGRRFLAEVVEKSGDAAVRRDVRLDALEGALERGDLQEAKTLHTELSKEWGQDPRYAKALKALDPGARKAAPAAKQ
jgi:hypothetical protein